MPPMPMQDREAQDLLWPLLRRAVPRKYRCEPAQVWEAPVTKPLSRREAIHAKIYTCVAIVDTGYRDKDGNASCCHLWTAGDSGKGRGGGYPRMWLDGQVVAVHIVNWTNEHGYVPGKKELDHRCKQRLCVNDEHLELVSRRVNQLRVYHGNGITRAKPTKRKQGKRAPNADPFTAILAGRMAADAGDYGIAARSPHEAAAAANDSARHQGQP